MSFKKCFAAIAIVAIAGCSILGIVVEKNNIKTDIDLSDTSVSSVAATQFAAEIQEDNRASETGLSEEPEQENELITTETPTDIQIAITSEKVAQLEYFAEITIKTCKKIGTYAVTPNVNERTLKNNIGWLPSSSLPGEDGLCVLMGHRDTDFMILQDIEVGDEIVVDYGVSSFVYTVTKVEVVDSDNELKFSVMSGSWLALVTCYPFYYLGHAPKKFIVYSIITKRIGC